MFLVSEILTTLQDILGENDTRVNEANLLIPDNYGKFSISLDEMMPDVIVYIYIYSNDFSFRVLLKL